MLSDALPNKFGSAVIDAWRPGQGRDLSSLNGVERLCYTETRGMGALEFEPSLGDKTKKASRIQVSQLVEVAS